MTSPYIRKSVLALDPYVPGEQASGMIKLNTNENPYPPPAAVERLLRDYDPAALRLYPNANCDALRARLAELNGCLPDQIFVGNGSDEILRLAARAFTTELRPAILALDPTYSLYPVIAATEGIPYRTLPLAGDYTSFTFTKDDAAGLFFLANPNAPTGVLQPLSVIEKVATDFPGVVLVDEAYVDFAGEGASALPLALTKPNVLVSRTFSKSGALAGLRVGYAIGPADLISAFYRLKDSYNVNRLSQEIALAALSEVEVLKANAQQIIATRERVAAELTRRGWCLTQSAANFLWCKPPEGAPSAEVYLTVLRSANILVRHFAGHPRTKDCLRISIGTDAEMDALLAAL